MKYYHYISNSKIDMLFPQIPKKFIKTISTKMNIKAVLFDVELTGKEITETHVSKLKLVSEYIHQNKPVGDLNNPEPYIYDILSMKSNIFEEYGIILFSHYCTNVTKPGATKSFLLCGSSKHAIGMDDSIKISASSTTAIINKLNCMKKNIEKLPYNFLINDINMNVIETDYLNDIKYWSSKSQGPVRKLEFLARTLLYENLKGSTILLATPIYVADVDE